MKRTKLSALVTILTIAISLAIAPVLGAHVAQECYAVGCGFWATVGGAMIVAALAPTGVGGVVATGVFAA